jgi:hypothetical protein
MYYLLISGNFQSIQRLLSELLFNPLEHRTGSVANGLINHYFDSRLGYINTPEQFQNSNRTRPDFSTERNGLHVAFTEIKRALSRVDFEGILDQLQNSDLHTIDNDMNRNSFVTIFIAIRGLKIALY